MPYMSQGKYFLRGYCRLTAVATAQAASECPDGKLFSPFLTWLKPEKNSPWPDPVFGRSLVAAILRPKVSTKECSAASPAANPVCCRWLTPRSLPAAKIPPLRASRPYELPMCEVDRPKCWKLPFCGRPEDHFTSSAINRATPSPIPDMSRRCFVVARCGLVQISRSRAK